MRRAIKFLLVLSLVLAFRPTQAQQERRVYLPLMARSDNVSDWKIIVPESTTNHILDPACGLGTFGNGYWDVHDGVAWQPGWLSQVAGSKPWQGSGFYYRLTAGANHNAEFTERRTFAVAAGETVTMQVWINATASSGTPGNARMYSAGNDTTVAMSLVETTGNWSLYEGTFASMAADSYRPGFLVNGVLNGEVVDWGGIQFEKKAYRTTLCAGSLRGCEWLGTPDHSTSRRSAQSRAGGREYDLQTDYHLNVSDFIGTGMPPLTLAVDSYAILPGGQLNSIKTHSRVFTLVGFIQGDDLNQVHDYRQELLDVLKKDAVPPDEYGYQPVLIRYTGADVEKEIAVHYEAGLEANISARQPCWEMPVAIRFLAPDPFWYEIGESAQLLDSNDALVLRYCTGRLRDTGQWDDLGLAANPTAGGTIYAILFASDKTVYFGGSFTGWGAVGGRDYIARYDPQTDTWSTVGAGGTFNNSIYALAEAADGTIYIGGNFLNAGGAAGDYIAQYDPSTNVVSPVAAGGTAAVRALAVGSDGILYIGGDFLNWNAIANADYIVSWNGAAYAALGTGMNAGVTGLAVNKQENIIYAVGAFTTAGGVDAIGIAAWDTSAWSDVGSTSVGIFFNGVVYAVVVSDADGAIYVTGVFNTPGVRIARWNGTAWSGLGSGLNNTGRCLVLGPDGVLYAGGDFTEAGGIALANRMAKWNGSSWAHLDVDLPGAPSVYALAVGLQDPIITNNYDLYTGFSTTGNATAAGIATADNEGSAPAYPLLVISRSGGTSAALTSIRNETNGKELLFDYNLLDGEILTIDTMPLSKSVTSNFWGRRPDAILPNSDFSSWVLQPDDNDVTCFVDVAGAPTIEAYMVWREAFVSSDK